MTKENIYNLIKAHATELIDGRFRFKAADLKEACAELEDCFKRLHSGKQSVYRLCPKCGEGQLPIRDITTSAHIHEKVYKFPTKHKEGLVQSEVDALLKDYPDIDMEKFNSALMGNTCMVKEGEIIQYHSDIVKALVCGIEKRNLRSHEWD